MDEEAIRRTIKPASRRLSVYACLLLGHAWVNAPVVALMLAGLLGAAVIAHALPQDQELQTSNIVLVVATGLGGWLAAWSWWSWTVPKWRIWALQHVDDWPTLRRRAVATGLIWPDGWIFEKTEFKSKAQRETEKTLRRIREVEG